ncbi:MULTISPECIES: ribulose-phosphate 3-epimerase [Tetragenococcus]|uniref:ribulose-phosphate 3-epimerase n=1 Tax=Tetragenococcus TaxID=51668 RepID=UPI001D130CF6|nr:MULTISPECIES: ribulose-phosphate 3-epimerase [Tetragenococcus]
MKKSLEKIAASIMCADMLNVQTELERLEKTDCDLLHLDVMDGVFVDNLALGPEWMASVKKQTSLPFDIHLATEMPEKYVEMFRFLKPETISFHIEAAANPILLIHRLKNYGIKPSLALNPATPIEDILPYLAEVDQILLMTVPTGFAGQAFRKETLEKLCELKNILAQRNLHPLIEVDGNINTQTISWMKEVMPDIFVLGTSALFQGGDANSYQERIRTVRQAVNAYKSDF